MRTLVFASRNAKEILRDIITLFFGIAFPIILLLLLSAINAGIPDEAQMTIFEAESLTPGIAAFGLSFISLFSAMLISKDRSTSFVLRLFTSPLKPSGYLLGYTIPLLPMALAQTVVCYIAAFFLGLEITPNVLLAIVVSIPTALMFIAVGLLCGTLLNDKMVGGVCGALLANLCGWLSGTWFDVSLVGGAFESVAKVLPFVHAVDAGRAALSGNYSAIMPELWWVIGYAVVLMTVAVAVFTLKMKRDK